MRILSLASLDETTEIALVVDGREASSRRFPSSTRLSEAIWEEIENALRTQNLTLQEINAFAVVRGPGSYTSLRVGLSAMNGLAWSLNRPIVGFLRAELEESPTASLAISAGLRAYKELSGHPSASYLSPVMPEYGAEFRLGG